MMKQINLSDIPQLPSNFMDEPPEDLQPRFRLHITTEWAKQLAHDFIDEHLDFANMRAIAILAERTFQDPETMRLDGSPKIPLDPSRIPGFKIEKFEIRRIYDALNNEIHFMGYGLQTNTLIWQQDARNG